MLRPLIAAMTLPASAIAAGICFGTLIVSAVNDSLPMAMRAGLWLVMVGLLVLTMLSARYLYPSRSKMKNYASAVHRAVEQHHEGPMPSTKDDTIQAVVVGFTADGRTAVILTGRRATARRLCLIDTTEFRIEKRVDGRKRLTDYLWCYLPPTESWLEDLLRRTKCDGARYSPECDEGWGFFGKAVYILAN